ncbi:MAG: hypothetical protein AAF434_20470 [Pseudomonadota bacterium]
MSLIVVFASLFVLLSEFLPSQEPDEVIAIPITILRENSVINTQWDGLPVMVILRSDQTIASLDSHAAALRDPDSDRSTQPDGARNAWRSLRPEIFVAIALGTDLRCPIKPRFEGEQLQGFVDQCRGWRYDAAGRVFDAQDALRNLRVPPYRITEEQILIGAQ